MTASIASPLSGSGTLTSAFGIQSNLSGAGALTSVLGIASALSGSGTLTSTFGIQSKSYSAAWLFSSLKYRTRFASTFGGEGVLYSELGYVIKPTELDTAPLGKLVSFNVSTSAVPLNAAVGFRCCAVRLGGVPSRARTLSLCWAKPTCSPTALWAPMKVRLSGCPCLRVQTLPPSAKTRP